MNFPMVSKQKGATLLVGMIMLVVLTLLVVFAIRSGNTNLKIAGNMQSQAEAGAVAQQAIEGVIEQVKIVGDFTTIKLPAAEVTVNNVAYAVTLAPMKCNVDVPVLNSELDPANANDVPCFENPDDDKAIKSDGTLTSKPSACRTQQWEIEATVIDDNSGASVTQTQGISVRVPATVTCS